MPRPPKNRAERAPQSGLTLILVLAGLLLVAALVLTLQARASADLMALARIEAAHRDAVARSALAVRTRAALVGGASPPLRMREAGRNWLIQVRDVEGLVDLYLAPPEVLALTGRDGVALAQARDALLSVLPAGARLSGEAQTLAALGLDGDARARIMPLVTQRARTGAINPALSPRELDTTALPPEARDIAGGDLGELTILPLP